MRVVGLLALGLLTFALSFIVLSLIRDQSPSPQEEEPVQMPTRDPESSTIGRWVFPEVAQGPYGDAVTAAVSPAVVAANDTCIRTVFAVVAGGPGASSGFTFGGIVDARSDDAVQFRTPAITMFPRVTTWQEVGSSEDVAIFFE